MLWKKGEGNKKREKSILTICWQTRAVPTTFPVAIVRDSLMRFCQHPSNEQNRPDAQINSLFSGRSVAPTRSQVCLFLSLSLSRPLPAPRHPSLSSCIAKLGVLCAQRAEEGLPMLWSCLLDDLHGDFQVTVCLRVILIYRCNIYRLWV
jgi:hypothetical protein